MALPKILSNSVIYTAVTILQRGISFFLLPLYTCYLTPADYGITGVVASVSSLLAIFTTLGLSNACARFYYKHNGDPDYSHRLFGTIGLTILITSALFGTLFVLLHKWIIDPLLGEIAFYPYVLLGLLNVLVTPLYTLFQGYLQTIQDGLKYGINAMLYFLLQVGLTILLVAGMETGALGVLLANFITAIVFFVYVIIAFFRHQTIVIDKIILKESYRYSLPLLPHTIANWSNGTIDRLLVNGIRSEADAGLYNLGRQYASVAETLAVSINGAYVPWFFDKTNDIKNNLSQIRQMSEMINYVVCFIAIIMSLFAKEVLDLMISNPAYDGVWQVIPFVISGIIFNNIYFFYVNVLFLNNTGVIFTITVSTIAINVGLNLYLIPIYGFIGCGIAVFATYFMKSVIAVFISMKKNKEIRFRTFYLYMVGSISSLICLSAFYFSSLSFLFSITIKNAVVAAIAFFIYYHYQNDINTLVKSVINKRK